MPGYAFQLEVLKQVRTELLRGENRDDGALLDSPYARLGAFGPDLLLYAPPIDTLATDLAGEGVLALVAADIATLDAADLAALQDLFEKPVGCAYSALFSKLVIPLWPDLVTIIEFVAQAGTIADTKDTSALAGFFSQLKSVSAALQNLGTNTVPALKTLLSLATLIVGGPWMEVAPVSAELLLLLPKADPRACRPYEFLRWHKSGQFAAALWANAESANQRAFALGWMSHVAASVTGEPFVSNIVGGPYRTHWWRNRLASNFVDAWTYGYFEEAPAPASAFPSMNGDEPTPAYEAWAPLYGANLQNLFDVGNLAGSVTNGIPDAVTAVSEGVSSTGTPNLMTTLAARFPAEITDLLDAALTATYPAGSQPRPPATLTADLFSDAYVGAFAVHWFLTSGQGPLGNNVPGPAPSTACAASPPSWTTSASTPPPASGSVVTHSGSAACDAVLAILALLSFLTGNVAAGIGLTVAALEEIPSTDINWPVVQCDVYWLQTFVDKILNALRDALWMMTLAYPPPIMLGGPGTDGTTIPATDFTDVSTGQDPPAQLPGNEPPTGGIPLTKTNDRDDGDRGRYPHGLDTGPGPDGNAIIPDLDFLRFPLNAPLETDTAGYRADDLIPVGIYPDQVVNGMGLLNGGMMEAVPTFPTRDVPFGDAVNNALQVITAKAAGLPDYNLDGDRGYGWVGWRPAPLTDPAAPPVNVEAD